MSDELEREMLKLELVEIISEYAPCDECKKPNPSWFGCTCGRSFDCQGCGKSFGECALEQGYNAEDIIDATITCTSCFKQVCNRCYWEGLKPAESGRYCDTCHLGYALGEVKHIFLGQLKE